MKKNIKAVSPSVSMRNAYGRIFNLHVWWNQEIEIKRALNKYLIDKDMFLSKSLSVSNGISEDEIKTYKEDIILICDELKKQGISEVDKVIYTTLVTVGIT